MKTSNGTKERIAFVGVGRMGANMARRLKDCGCDKPTAIGKGRMDKSAISWLAFPGRA